MRLSTLAVLGLLLTTAASAQTSDVRRVVLTDGSTVVGTVVDESADPVVVITASGVEQRIPRARIVRIVGLAGGRFERTDPTRTRLLFSPTGRTLGRRGQTRLGVLTYVIPNLTYAASSRVDVGAAGFFAFGGGGGGVLVPGVKAQVVDAPGVAVAVGASAVIPITSDSDVNGSFIGTPYVAATFGDESRSATLGVTGFFGADVSNPDFTFADGVLVSAGGEVQTSSRLKLLGEVLVPVGEGTSGVAFLPGVRFFGDRFSADLFGVIGFGDGDAAGFAPIASFAYNF